MRCQVARGNLDQDWDIRELRGSSSGKATNAVAVSVRGGAVVAVSSAKPRRVAVPATPAQHAVGVIASVIVRIAIVCRANF